MTGASNEVVHFFGVFTELYCTPLPNFNEPSQITRHKQMLLTSIIFVQILVLNKKYFARNSDPSLFSSIVQ
jgi:hypothetical protein